MEFICEANSNPNRYASPSDPARVFLRSATVGLGRPRPVSAPNRYTSAHQTGAEQSGAMAGAEQLRSFVEVPAGSHFPIQNLPFGVVRRRGSRAPPRPAVAIGDLALDLAAVADAGLFDGPALAGSPCFQALDSVAPVVDWADQLGLAPRKAGLVR